MLKIYAILDKKTNIVLNLVHIEQEEYLFFNKETEYVVPANRSVQIGMTYNKTTKKFPEADETIELKDEINNLISIHREKISENYHLTSDQLKVHLDYISSLEKMLLETSYENMKFKLDNRDSEPEFPPKPKEITQEVFRSALKITEKVLWDNPETGTTQQTAAINTIKMDFPYYGIDTMIEELDLLESVGVLTASRVKDIKSILS